MRAFVVTPGFEEALTAELGGGQRTDRIAAPGVVLVDDTDAAAASAIAIDPVFSRQVLPDTRAVTGQSVRELAEGSFAVLAPAIDGADRPFTLHAFPHAADTTAVAPVTRQQGDPMVVEAGLGSRVELVGREVLALLQQRRRRAFRFHVRPEEWSGLGGGVLLQILALSRSEVLVSAAVPRRLASGGSDLAPWAGGNAPVAVDRAPPSRAYQKLEEAFLWMGATPRAGQVCVDLGASPGGWTLTALRHGARVIAVDRSPLAPPAAGHARLTMTLGNAFTYAPPHPVDWLLCDVVCEPPRTIALLERWLAAGWSRNLVCTVKFKGRDGYGALAALPPLFAPYLAGRTLRFARVKHLAHNKNEVTVMAGR